MENARISFFFTVVLLLLASRGYAITYTSAADGYWQHNATWVGGINVPQNGDAIVIDHNVRLTLDIYSNYVFKSITVNAGASLTIDSLGYVAVGISGIGKYVKVYGSLIIGDDGILEVGGAEIQNLGSITINAPNGGLDATLSPLMLKSGSSLNLNNGVVYANTLNLNVGGAYNANGGLGIITITGATLDGTVTTTTTFPISEVLTSFGSIEVGGSIGVGATTMSQNYVGSTSFVLKPGSEVGSEVRYLSAGDQTIDPSLSYYNLTLEGSGNKTIRSAITVLDQFRIDGSARFANYNRNVTCGSSLTNNSAANHIFGSGTYTFTGTTIGGTAPTVIDSATLSFTGSSITLGDGAIGNGDLTFKNVSLSNASSDLVIGAGGYTGSVVFGGLLSMTGSSAAMTVSGGTVSMNNLIVSGTSSSVRFMGGVAKHSVSGNITCGNTLTIGTPVGIQGDVLVSSSLTVNSECDITGITTVNGNLNISGSNAPSINSFTGAVTVNGPAVAITGGINAFSSGFTHNTAAVGSTCLIGGSYSDGIGSSTTTLNAASIALSGTLNFNNLVVSNASGSLTASSDFQVNGTLSLAKDLSMTGYRLTFPVTAPQLAISGAGEVVGTVRRSLQATGTYTFNGAYISLLVPNLAAAEEYDFKLMKMAPDQQAVTRCYDIQRVSGDVTPASWLYTLGLYYKDAELNGNNENTLMMAYGVYDVAGEDQFTKISSSSVNTNSNIVTFVFDGITSLNHRYAIADLNAPLPVELVSFAARRKEAAVELRWKTATELNNFGFDIERAREKDGPYESIAFVEGQGSKNTPTDYTFTDADAPQSGVYYRLRQVDRDGAVSYSPIVEVLSGNMRFELGNYPNPFNPSTTITFQSPADGRAKLAVYNAVGEQVALVYDADVLRDEVVSVPFDAGSLPGGTYFYTVTVGDNMQTGKMLLTK